MQLPIQTSPSTLSVEQEWSTVNWPRVLLRLVACFLISAVLFYVTDHTVSSIEHQRAKEEATAKGRQWRDTFQAQLGAFETAARSLLAGDEELTYEVFAEAADPLIEDHGFLSVEWHPQVEPEDQAAFEQQLSASMGRAMQIKQRKPSGIETPLRAKRKLYPARFVVPAAFSQATLGLDRGHLDAPLVSGQSGQMHFTAKRRFYLSTTGPRIAVCLADWDAAQPGYVLATFHQDEFGLTGFATSERTIGRFCDITNDSKTLYLSTNELFDVQSKNPLIEAQQPWSAANKEFLLEFTQNPNYRSRLAYLPWCALAAGPIWWCQRTRRKWRTRAMDQARLNGRLRSEIQQQVSSQRNLKSLLQFREQERLSIANEIHDGFVQEAFGAQMFLESLVARVGSDLDPTANSHLHSTMRQLERCITEARQLVSSLQPSVLEQLGFLPAIKNLAESTADRYGFKVSFTHSEEFPDVHINTQRALYRIVQESLANIRKHSGADEATIKLHHDTENVFLEITDSGEGFDQESHDDSGFGLRGIRDRAGHLNGTARIRSRPGQGTCVRVEVPYSVPTGIHSTPVRL